MRPQYATVLVVLDITSLTATIRHSAATYVPAPLVQAQLQEINLVALIGPLAVGKTSIMEAASQRDTNFGRTHGFTTRQQRPDEQSGSLHFVPHTIEGLTGLQQRIAHGELVQFIVHPTTGFIYGTDDSDYTHTYTMLDTLPDAIPALQNLPAKAVKKVAIVVQPDIWVDRLHARFRISSREDLRKRLAEGIDNLSWCLEHSADLAWVNSGTTIEQTVTDFMTAVTQENFSDPNGPAIAQNLLVALRSLLPTL